MAEAISAKVAWALSKAIKGASENRSSGNTTKDATVVRKDPDGTVWVRMAGSDIDTPINGSITASVKAGDVVQCRVDGTVLSLTGNATDPAIGVSKVVSIASSVANVANETLIVGIQSARAVAEAAEKVAKAVNQNFWTDGSGIHVTEVTQEEWSNPTGSSYHSGPNVLINSLGQLFRDGLNNLLTMTSENGARAFTIWDGAGNAASNILASFGAIVKIGRETTGHIELSSVESESEHDYSVSSMDLYGTDGQTRDVHVYSRGPILDDTHEDRDYDVPAAGIEFGGGYKSGGSSIYTLFDNLANRLNICSGSESITNGSTIQLVATRRWVSDASKTDMAAQVFNVDKGGNSPYSRSTVQSGANRADFELTASSSYSQATLDADRAYINGNLILDSIGWTNLSLSSSAKAYTDAQTPRYCRKCGVVALVGEVSPKSEVAAGGELAIGTLPVGCRPYRRTNVLCQGSGNRQWLLQVNTDGTVTATRYRLGDTSVAMPTDAWMPFHVVFVSASAY